MDAKTMKRMDEAILEIFAAEGIDGFERIGFLETMKARLEAVWIRQYYEAV